MQWTQADGVWTTQQCTWLHGSEDDEKSQKLQRHRGLWDALYSSLLLRDVAHVIPYRTGEIALLGQSEGVESTIASALVRECIYGRRDLTDAVRGFCESCIPRVVSAGQAVFEVVFTKGKQAAPAPDSFYLVHVQNYRRRLGRHMQYVPREGWKRIEGERLVVFQLSKNLRVAVDKAMRVLASGSGHQSVLHEVVRNRPAGYDFREHRKREEIVLSRATREVGWRSPHFSEYALEPYEVSRHLTWYEFRAELREIAIVGLNRALRIAGSAMGFDSQLECRGLYTHDDVAQARERLEKGQCGRLVELIEPFLQS